MSLRVLLADESPSIKKAFDLALKDFAVTVQTVHQGTDVLELFSSFKPDICFLDVLLPKKNGYDACINIKQSDRTQTPVVLMWSNFMEVDESKFKDCGAEAKIEKPFEAKTLRNIVMEHVPKVKQNKISEFLEPIAKIEHAPEAPQDSEPIVPPLKEDVEAQSEDEIDTPLPDIDSMFYESSQASEDVDDLNNLDHTKESKTSTTPLKSVDDPFSSLDLQESSSDNDDLEDFQMEPLESFDPQGKTASENDPPPTEETTSSFIPPLDDENSFEELGTDATDPPLDKEASSVSETSTDAVPPIPDDMGQEIKDFNSEDDEITIPSISIVDEPLISPPPPPSDFDTPAQASKANATASVKESAEASDNSDANKKKTDLDLDSQLSKDELKRLIMAQSKDIIESVVWEVIPELAKEMIKKEIERLTGELNPNEEAL